MQGVHAEVNKFFTKSVQNYIITSRVVQGQRDFNNATEAEREDIVKRWNNNRVELKSFRDKKQKDQKGKGPEEVTADKSSASTNESGGVVQVARWLQARHGEYAEGRRFLSSQKSAGKKDRVEPTPASSATSQPTTAEDKEFEQAIMASVRETSQGDAEEDARVEAAIRESVRAVREQGSLPEPIPEVSEKGPGLFNNDEYQITDEEYQALVEKAVQQSMAAESGDLPPDYGGSSSSFIDSKIPEAYAARLPPTDDIEDKDLKLAIEESRKVPPLPPRAAATDDDAEMQRAITSSKEEMERKKSEMTEEQIVMEYVKKQSLMEEELRRKAGKGKDKAPDQPLEDDEEFRKAMEESLKMSGGDGAGPSGDMKS